MKEPRSNPYEQFLHPYVFVLQEGSKIKQDFLDYSLMLLQVGKVDVIHSPSRSKNMSTPISINPIQFIKR